MPIRFSILFAAAAFLAACSNQAEGEVCSHLADNQGLDDCQDGLRCVSLPGVNGDRCCPDDRTKATTTVCAAPGGFGGGDAAPPPVDGSVDAQGDSSDAPAESTSSSDSSDAGGG